MKKKNKLDSSKKPWNKWDLNHNRLPTIKKMRMNGLIYSQLASPNSITRDNSDITLKDGNHKKSKIQKLAKNKRKCKNIWKKWWKNQSFPQASHSTSPLDKNSKWYVKIMPSNSAPVKNTNHFKDSTKSSKIPMTSMLSFNSLNSIPNTLTVFTQSDSFFDYRAIIKTLTTSSKESSIFMNSQEDTTFPNS